MNRLLIKFLRDYRAVTRSKNFAPNVISQAGESGENILYERLQKYENRGFIRIFRNRRVKDEQNNLHEFDAIVVKESVIFLIEVKNWSGKITQKDGKWLQHKKRGVIAHDDVLKKLLKNTQIFENYLIRYGVDITKFHLRPVVVFANKNTRLDEELKNQIFIKNLNEFLRLLSPFKKKIPIDDKLFEAINSMKLWTKLYLYGGRVEMGHIRYLIIDGKRERPPRHFRLDATLDWSRNQLTCFIKSAILRKKKKLKIKNKVYHIRPSDKLIFVSVEEKRPIFYKFGSIDRIVKDAQ